MDTHLQKNDSKTINRCFTVVERLANELGETKSKYQDQKETKLTKGK